MPRRGGRWAWTETPPIARAEAPGPPRGPQVRAAGTTAPIPLPGQGVPPPVAGVHETRIAPQGPRVRVAVPIGLAEAHPEAVVAAIAVRAVPPGAVAVMGDPVLLDDQAVVDDETRPSHT